MSRCRGQASVWLFDAEEAIVLFPSAQDDGTVVHELCRSERCSHILHWGVIDIETPLLDEPADVAFGFAQTDGDGGVEDAEAGVELGPRDGGSGDALGGEGCNRGGVEPADILAVKGVGC